MHRVWSLTWYTPFVCMILLCASWVVVSVKSALSWVKFYDNIHNMLVAIGNVTPLEVVSAFHWVCITRTPVKVIVVNCYLVQIDPICLYGSIKVLSVIVKKIVKIVKTFM